MLRSWRWLFTWSSLEHRPERPGRVAPLSAVNEAMWSPAPLGQRAFYHFMVDL